MERQTRRAGYEPRWFLTDRPIETEQADRLGSTSLARTLVEAIAAAEPPCMIGLLGGFGSGKSSVTSLSSSMLDDSRFDSVAANADKMPGIEPRSHHRGRSPKPVPFGWSMWSEQQT